MNFGEVGDDLQVEVHLAVRKDTANTRYSNPIYLEFIVDAKFCLKFVLYC